MYISNSNMTYCPRTYHISPTSPHFYSKVMDTPQTQWIEYSYWSEYSCNRMILTSPPRFDKVRSIERQNSST
ncbi:hypothetical protein CEXT_801961 [Caerostris extrusa]|uniref:Uncharacterized protein n=1 Tax=Caerostris extrusa TaxID=172846 RepID=A0AAV4QZJ1_CAEEX|nr:hypothetical protein CEXT_801961 [Caerostris extrusa]